MPSLVVLGANGFLGKSFISNSRFKFPVKAVTRSIRTDQKPHIANVTWYCADLQVPGSLDSIIECGDIVINLVFVQNTTDIDDNIRIIDNLIDTCLQNKISRLIHCSTALVVGSNKNSYIDETSVCVPRTEYEKIKFKLEQRLLNSGLSVVILRPTVIIGAHGLNLCKLANSLLHGNSFINYVRACGFNKRRMNLVSVHNVVSALNHLAAIPYFSKNEIYHISSDDDPKNNFLSIEHMLLKALGLKTRKFPILAIPSACLSILLRLRRGFVGSVSRIYVSKKIFDTKFISCHSINDAINEFANTIKRENSL